MTPAVIALILQYGIQYGPGIAQEVIALFKKQDATIADVEALFAKIKPYDQYNIPNLPTPPTPA